jgi:hypothetical protein
VSDEEGGRLFMILQRAKREGLASDLLSLEMDIRAAMADVPLDLARLARFPAFDFAHDILGIMRHMDRKTGKLAGGFLPRCAR